MINPAVTYFETEQTDTQFQKTYTDRHNKKNKMKQSNNAET